MSSSLLIRNGQVADSNTPAAPGDLLLEGGRIAARGPCGSIPPPAGCREIDAEGLFVFPGLIDTHAHYLQESIEGYNMLVEAGVTTALDACISMPQAEAAIARRPVGLNTLFLFAIWPGRNVNTDNPGTDELRAAMRAGLAKGAFGIKIIGGHAPFTPEATARAIAVAHELRIPITIHAGTTNTPDNLNGCLEICDLAADNPLHLAHINCYCDGRVLTGEPMREAADALAALQRHPAIVSESNLGSHGWIGAALSPDGIPASRAFRDTLAAMGYPPNRNGIEDALADGAVVTCGPVDGRYRILPHDEGLRHFRETPSGGSIGLPERNMGVSAALASAKSPDGSFTITALATDAGILPRNHLLDRGLALVEADILSLPEYLHKVCAAPAAMLGLDHCKGTLTPGMDADVILVDPTRRVARTVISGGQAVYDGGTYFAAPNRLLGLPVQEDERPAWVRG